MLVVVIVIAVVVMDLTKIEQRVMIVVRMHMVMVISRPVIMGVAV